MCDDPAVATRCRRPVGDALPNSLMRTRSIEERRILARRPSEMVLIEYEHVIEYLAPQRSHKSLCDRVHVRRPNGRLDHPNPNALCRTIERPAVLVVAVADQESRCCP